MRNVLYFSEFHDAFCVFDKKHKGHIGNSDIKLLMRSLGFNPTETEVENMCMKVDYDGNYQLPRIQTQILGVCK